MASNTLFTQLPVRDSVGSAGLSRVATLTASETLTAEKYDRRVILLDAAAGLTITLPAASGSGAKFEFIVKTTVTSNSAVIKVANTTDSFIGNGVQAQDSGSTNNVWEIAASDDTITLNGTTTGGLRGDRIVVEDILSGIFHVTILGAATGTEATPFSATV